MNNPNWCCKCGSQGEILIIFQHPGEFHNYATLCLSCFAEELPEQAREMVDYLINFKHIKVTLGVERTIDFYVR